jgi:hypothetical protein
MEIIPIKKIIHPGRAGSNLWMAGGSLGDAMRAALKVKLSGVQKFERAEAAGKKRKKR